MFETAIGRVQNIIEGPPRSLDMWVYLDAGGKAGNQRVWGGLAAIGVSEINWIEKVLNDIGENTNDAAELKGRELGIDVIKLAGRRIREEDRRVLFWANKLPDWCDKKSQECSRLLNRNLTSMKPNLYHQEQLSIEIWQDDIASYFEELKPINKHKLLSIIMHIQWLIDEIKRTRLGGQLKSARLIVDSENFPNETQCGIVVKSFFAAGLQSAGMAYSLTGTTFREEAHEGNVSVNVAGKSENDAGIRYVDILLQAVLRKVMPIG